MINASFQDAYVLWPVIGSSMVFGSTISWFINCLGAQLGHSSRVSKTNRDYNCFVNVFVCYHCQQVSCNVWFFFVCVFLLLLLFMCVSLLLVVVLLVGAWLLVSSSSVVLWGTLWRWKPSGRNNWTSLVMHRWELVVPDGPAVHPVVVRVGWL